jgi:hypothetical protein
MAKIRNNINKNKPMNTFVQNTMINQSQTRH